MSEPGPENKRRKFIEICVAGAAGSAGCLAAAAHAADNKNAPAKAAAPVTVPTKSTTPLAARAHARVKLVDQDGKAIKAKSLKPNHNYVFNYPYESTPCFLLNLDKALTEKVALATEAGNPYQWPGGVGSGKSIVAYSAICAHKLAYPTRQVSFIGFRAAASPASPRGKVITCCADKSVYDPFAGAKVVSGPAPQPLAAIILEHDTKTDELYATGTLGSEKFNEFFQKYDFKLTMEMGGKAKDVVTGTTRLLDLAAYSMQTAQC
ncbi:MAG: (2Fe-2S)-binding protein [Betaproteobacteria bacterium]|nr:(2Fe-2S)-binding protein [Betaproteobacteria bacterium]